MRAKRSFVHPTAKGDAKFFRDMRDRATGQHPLDQDQTTSRSQPRITVDQEKAFLFQ